MADENLDNENLEELRNYLKGEPAGAVGVGSLLVSCWDQLSTLDEGGMSSDKLYDRIENAKWDPPSTLTFDIERHGTLMCGSTQAEIQHWVVDIHAATARLSGVGKRQIIPRQPNLDVKPLAQEIALLICGNHDDARLRWHENRLQVRVCVGKVQDLETGSAVPETLQGRRKRFRTTLSSILAPKGWEYVNSAGGIYGGPLFKKI